MSFLRLETSRSPLPVYPLYFPHTTPEPAVVLAHHVDYLSEGCYERSLLVISSKALADVL